MRPTNPYESPQEPQTHASGDFPQPPKISRVAMGLALASIAGLFSFGTPLDWIGQYLVLLGYPALLVGIIALFFPPRRLAVWSIVLAIISSLFIPTLLLPFFSNSF